MAICRKQQTEPVDLDHCLRAFTSEEKLEECYHCSNCKSKQPATKKLQIWKLPPILIVHLKRFNFVNNKWVKSQKVVNFPFKDFDPTPYLASVPQETILRHKELIEHGNVNALSNGLLSSSNSSIDTSEITPEHSVISDSIKEIETVDTESTNLNSISDTISEIAIKTGDKKVSSEEIKDKMPNTGQSSSSNSRVNSKSDQKASVHSIKRTTHSNPTKNMRKRLVSTSLIKSPVIDGAFIDYHKHHLDEGEDPFDLKYKLYAVVVS